MIKPSTGRVVWYHGSKEHDAYTMCTDQPCAAMVTYVHSDRCVNLIVFDCDGRSVGRTSVTLLQDDDLRPEGGRFAEWMPYQKGQAAKTEALERLAS